MIIFIILLIIIYLIYKYSSNKKSSENKSSENKSSKNSFNKNSSQKNSFNKKIKLYNNIPAFRGHADFQIHEKKEYGGIKAYKHIILDNSNMYLNQMNYQVYDSYRKKPFLSEK